MLLYILYLYIFSDTFFWFLLSGPTPFPCNPLTMQMRLPSGMMSGPSPSPTQQGTSAPPQGQTQPRTWEEETQTSAVLSIRDPVRQRVNTHRTPHTLGLNVCCLWTETCYCKQGCSWSHTYSCPYWHTGTHMSICAHALWYLYTHIHTYWETHPITHPKRMHSRHQWKCITWLQTCIDVSVCLWMRTHVLACASLQDYL